MQSTSSTLDHLQSNPRQVFLLDGIGALISTIFLGFILVQLRAYIGMPSSVLYLLASMAFIYTVFSFSCYFFLKGNWSPFLKIIGTANLLHCAVTSILIFNNFDSLTSLGIAYFVGEIIIVVWVAWVELKIAKVHSN